MAFNIDVPDYVVDASIDCCKRGNMGNRGDGSDGSKEQQLIGIIGQNMMNLAIGKPLMQPGGGFDGGVDFDIFGLKFDVKTMGRSVAPRIDFVNNLVKSQTKFNVDGYVFMSLNKTNNVLTVCGWLPKLTFLERAQLYTKGTIRTRADGTTFEMKTDTYEIPNQDLFHRAKNWPELFVEINHISSEANYE